jgi:hypothetical protein
MLLPAAPPGRPALRLLLDQEPQRPGEDEVQTALRLLRRGLARYPRAFDLVLADALYAVAPFFNFLLTHRKHALVVLKQERHSITNESPRRPVTHRRLQTQSAVEGRLSGPFPRPR